MKNIKKLCFLVLSITTLISCSNEPEIGSTITVYPIITVSGTNPFFVPLGTTYTDPGATAKAGSTTIPVTTVATGKYRGTKTLDTSKADEYLVTYTATNSDGFDANASRKVIVYKNGDLVNSIEGLYTCTISRNGVTPSDAYRNIKYIHIWKNTDGTYGVSDSFGGWYEYGRAIADSETPGGIINAVNISTNTFTFPGTLTNSYFGGSATITSLTVDAASKKVVLTCVWNTAAPVTVYTFVATLTQVQP
ncbi:immunoglobulin-like domain-containing protein [Flavobacterium eburneipallidum]|uniref:immunoglobulin-like domain-containing protein n=1 Tax=Flavobacterium eburneipallidum TaxID=3003263 RepID=UPI002482E123|nr:immunoglobulin-like domain-containing protein [Flavobacterium eburneipallidum]